MKYVVSGFIAVLASISPQFLQAREAHVHGTAELHIAVEGDGLSIELHSPLVNLLGFEHPPSDDAQRQAVRTMMSRLRDSAKLFRLSPAASCRSSEPTIDSPFDHAASAESGHEHGHDGNEEGDHLDIESTYEFKCAHPEKLTFLEVGIFDVFPGFRTINAEIAGPRGQSAASLTRDRRVVQF
jgi:hypothetical protein